MTISITNPELKAEFIQFAGGERHVQLGGLLALDDLSKVAMPAQIDIRAEIQSSADFMDLLLLHNALQHAYGDQNNLRINVEIPYFPYARQDRVSAIGQAFSLELVARLIRDLSLSRLTVWDAHSEVTLQLTGAINITQTEIIATSPTLSVVLKASNTVLVCPDKGAIKKCREVRNNFSVNEMVYASKQRNSTTGKIMATQLKSDDLSGKTAVIIDDICDGGRTFIEIAKRLREKNCERIVLYVTHGIFSKGLEVFNGLIDEIVTTDSFPQQEDSRLTVIKFLSNKQ